MPDEKRIPDPSADEQEAERDVLYALTAPEDNQPLWTIDDLARELGDPTISDAVRRLQRAGLVHRTSDGHVFASRAAVRYIQLMGRVI